METTACPSRTPNHAGGPPECPRLQQQRVRTRVGAGFKASRLEYRGCRVVPRPPEDPKSRSLNGGSYKVPLVV